MPTETKGKYELCVELVKATAWPILAVIFLVCFRTELHSILGQTESISIGQLSIKIGKRIKPSDEVKKALSALSSEGVHSLLDLSGNKTFANLNELIAIKELLTLKLITTKAEVHATDQTKTNSVIELTPLGNKTRDFLREIVNELAQEIRSAGNENSN